MEFTLTGITVFIMLFYGFVAFIRPDLSFNPEAFFGIILFIFALEIVMEIIKIPFISSLYKRRPDMSL